MLGPASLRSQQPTKSSLKTYGSRSKRTSTSATAASASGTAARQFSWDRLENERKARIEQAQARRVEQNGSNQSLSDLDVAAAIPDDDMLYSDSELDGDTQLDKTSNRATMTIHSNPFYTAEHVPSTQGSDSDQSDRLSQTRSIHRSSGVSTIARQSEQNLVMTIRSTQDSDPEMKPQPRARLSGGSNIRSAIRQLGPPRGNASAVPPSQLSLTSTKVSQTTDSSAHRKVMFQEKSFFEEDHGDEDSNAEGDDGDEVLFRTPSFHILQKLRELPKPRLPEPRVNPFGFGSLPESGSSSGSGQSSDSRPGSGQEIEKEGRDPSKISAEAPSKTTMRNPFLDSPTTKKSMDILNKRAQQLVELQRHRKPKGHHGTSKPDDDTSMEIEREELILDMYDYHQDGFKTSGPSSDSRSTEYGGATQSEHTSSRRNIRQTTPESQDADNTGRDDSLDIALGKRMSSIEITPRRLLAKQRRMADLSSMPPAPSFSNTSGADNTDDDNQSKPLRLFLDRDIPKNEQDDLDSILMRAQKNRRMLSSSSLLSGMLLGQKREDSSAPPPAQHSREHRGSSLAAPKRSQLPKFERSSSSNTLGVNSKPSPYKQDLPDDLRNPFHVSHDYTAESRHPDPQLIPSRELTPPQFVPQLLSRSLQPSPPPQKASIQKDHPNEAFQPLKYQPPERKIRSLRRPPAVLVSSRKSVFKPTVDDLLSICDQQFFTQFQHLDGNFTKNGQTHTRAAAEQTKDSRSILDFESLLPECMISSLNKIGEASYSEVYTVELPVEQQKERLVSRPQKQKHIARPRDGFALFQSPRLNTYVQESAEDDLLAAWNATEGNNKSGTTKLVMKVMPFYDDRDGSGTDSQVVQERGRRTKGRRKAETTLLALEDIYREAMVSTQIMHGWKGFIGSFGALVVRGKYPKTFLSVWDRFRKEKGTESERPDVFTKEQLYCIILLPYGGIDLEHSPLTDWRQAWSVLTQVAASLESKEQAPFWFEHRDLHWGNILVKGTQQKQIVFPKREKLELGDSVGISEEDTRDNGNSLNARRIPTFGIIVQMIDFTLARVQGDKGNLIYMDLEKDQDLFRGQGDYQFEIYRKMRKHIGKDWAASCPRTNLYWLHYVADKLLTEKNLQKPKQSSSSTTEGSLQTLSTVKRHSAKANLGVSEDEKLELWCYERVLAVSKMNLDRLDPSGQTPSGSVLDLLLFNQP
ncbi:hypothetical protein BGX26_009108 [Mortierella sp. AD094]|nr:hypothetical protein BGX26_009108 [Mortierella sp. AD094]